MPKNLRKERSDSGFIENSSLREALNYDILTTLGILNLSKENNLHVLDIGGGIGKFSEIIADNFNCKVDVLDPSTLVKKNFSKSKNLELISSKLEDFNIEKKYDFIFMNLILHHMICDDLKNTKNKQINSLKKALSFLKPEGKIIIQENFYNGFFNSDCAGRLIFMITKLKFIENLTRKLGANTAGEGVRFRSYKSWESIFKKCGLNTLFEIKNPNDGYMPILQKILLLCYGRFQSIRVCNLK